MHCGKSTVALLHANHLLGNLDGVRELCIEACHKSIGITCLNHHHTKIIALEHLVIGLLYGITLTLTLCCQNLGITLATIALVRVTQIHNLNTIKAETKFCSNLCDYLIITKKNWMTYTLLFRLHGSLHH